jgi:hypothetical protein
MRLKKFNKDKSLKRIQNRTRIKLVSIIISMAILISSIVYISQARFESKVSYSLMKGNVSKRIIYAKDVILQDNKTVQDLIDELAKKLS